MSDEKKLYGMKGELLNQIDLDAYSDDGMCEPPLHVVIFENDGDGKSTDNVLFLSNPINSMKEGYELREMLSKHTNLDVTVEPTSGSSFDLTPLNKRKLALTDEEVEDLKALYHFVDEDSDMAKAMLKVLDYFFTPPTEPRNPNDGLVTWEYTSSPEQTAIKIRRALMSDKDENCYDNVSQIFEQLHSEGVINYDVEEGLKWK